MYGSNRSRPAGLAALVVAVLLAGASPLAGQSVGTIRGKVVEAGSMRPLNGVQISVDGSGRGALTNDAGEYLIAGIPAGPQVVRAQMIGYQNAEQTVSVAQGQAVRADFQLSQRAIAMDELVVTGTPGAVSKRTLGNTVATVNAADVTERTSISTVAELLQGRAPGVTMMGNGGTVGTSGSLRIRGASSLSGSNEPVVYVDGVRVYTGASGNFSNMFLRGGINADGGQDSRALSMINPEDIESIEVLKGPAASTLYGADAAAGVIQIITKKGRAGQQDLQWSLKAQTGWTDWAMDAVRNYTACTQTRQEARLRPADPASPPAWIGCQNVPRGSLINYSGLSDNPHGLRTGEATGYSLSVRGGGDGYSFYVAGDRSLDQGVFFNNQMRRTSGRANFSFYPNQKVDFSVNLGYDRSHTLFPTNDNGGEGLVISAAMWNPGWNYQANGNMTDEEFQQIRGFAWNPPNIANEYDNQLWGDRLTLGSTLNFRPFSWFQNRLTVGMDVNSREAQQYAAPRSPYSTEGFLYVRRPQDNIYTLDYSGTLNHTVTEGLTSNLSFGSQYVMREYKDTRSYGDGFASEFNRLVNQAARTRGSDDYLETASLGFYLQEQVGWRDRLFLTGAVRMDNSSVFGSDIQQIFYPKAMVSYIVSDEEYFTAPFVDELKLRAAWGEAGSAPSPFAAARQYSAVVGTLLDGGSVAGVRLGAFGNPGLKPERGQELEMGFESSLLGGRAGVDFTYYHKTMSDAIMSVPVVPSSGFTGSQYQNLGEIRNRGIELTLRATPVQSRPVTWNSQVSLYTNDNELVSFGYERSPISLGFYGAPQQHRPGYSLGGFWARRLVRDGDGSYARDAAGRLVLEDEASYIGPSTPTREVGFSNTLTLLGNLDLYVLLDYKGGHYQYNYKDLSRCAGSRCEVVARAEAVVDDPSASAQAREDAQLTLDLYTASGGLGTFDRKINFIQQADFVKLRDVSLTYRVPERFTNRVAANRVSFTVAGHDLAVWAPHYDGPDPEVNFYGDDDFLRVDAWTAPGLRRVTASVNVSF